MCESRELLERIRGKTFCRRQKLGLNHRIDWPPLRGIVGQTNGVSGSTNMIHHECLMIYILRDRVLNPARNEQRGGSLKRSQTGSIKMRHRE